jgi:hypothetical protein
MEPTGGYTTELSSEMVPSLQMAMTGDGMAPTGMDLATVWAMTAAAEAAEAAAESAEAAAEAAEAAAEEAIAMAAAATRGMTQAQIEVVWEKARAESPVGSVRSEASDVARKRGGAESKAKESEASRAAVARPHYPCSPNAVVSERSEPKRASEMEETRQLNDFVAARNARKSVEEEEAMRQRGEARRREAEEINRTIAVARRGAAALRDRNLKRGFQSWKASCGGRAHSC